MVPIQTKSYDSVRQSSNWNWVWSALLHVGCLYLATKSIANFVLVVCIWRIDIMRISFYFVHSWNSARRPLMILRGVKKFEVVLLSAYTYIILNSHVLKLAFDCAFCWNSPQKCVASVGLMLFFLFCSRNLGTLITYRIVYISVTDTILPVSHFNHPLFKFANNIVLCYRSFWSVIFYSVL